MVVAKTDKIKRLARRLAAEHMRAEPGIRKVYWFPHEGEVRLVEVEDNLPPSESVALEPFYFEASPSHGVAAPSCVALIRPDEFGKLDLPEEWGGWESARELETGE